MIRPHCEVGMFYILENTPLADKGPDVRRVDCFIQRMDPYPVGKNGTFLILIGQRENFYPQDRDLSAEKVIHSS